MLLLAAPSREDVWPDLPPPERGEWRWRHREEHQSLEAYRKSGPRRAAGKRRVLCVLPAWTRPGDERARMPETEKLLAAFFGRPVRRMEPRPLPKRAYDEERRQYELQALIPFLRRALPDDAAFLLVLTDRGLRLPGARHTDGWGSLEWRVGICSSRRLGDGKKRARRWHGLVLHEATHMLSVPHCTKRRCLMNGAMDFEESDRRPLLLCWECRSKVCWNAGLDVDERYGALLEAWRGAGFMEAVAMIGRALAVRPAPS